MWLNKLKSVKVGKRITLTFTLFSLTILSIIILVSTISVQAYLKGHEKKEFIRLNRQVIEACFQEHTLNIKNKPLTEETLRILKEDTTVNYSIQDNQGYQYANNTHYEAFFRNVSVLKKIKDNTVIFKSAKDINQTEIPVSTIEQDDIRYYYTHCILKLNDGYMLDLQLAKNVQINYSFIFYMTISGILSFLCGLILIGVFAAFVSNRVMLPFHKIADTSNDLQLPTALKTEWTPEQTDGDTRAMIIALNEMVNRLNKAYTKQTQLLSDVSHELRIPLTIVQGYLDIIQSFGAEDEQLMEESLDAIAWEVENMKQLIEKLLLLQKIENRTLKFKPEKVCISELVQKTADELQMIAPQHQVQAVLSQQPVYAKTDPNLLTQALRALGDNSIKYTPENGHIRLILVADKHYVYISIEDNGIGISAKNQRNVFERFYRVDTSRSREVKGSGLGLSIVKAIIERMKGQIAIKSGEGKGTTITIRLKKYKD